MEEIWICLELWAENYSHSTETGWVNNNRLFVEEVIWGLEDSRVDSWWEEFENRVF